AVLLALGARPSSPAAPAKPTATAMSLKAKVMWRAPAAHGSPIDSYTVAAFVGKTAKVTHVYKSKAWSQVVSGLKNGTAYTFKVRAHNKVGWGPYSPPSGPKVVG